MAPVSSRSNFFQRVYAIVSRIPKGRVATYGQIARLIGTRDAMNSADVSNWKASTLRIKKRSTL